MDITIKNVDDYIAIQTEDKKLILEKLRKIVRTTAPGAEEAISYGMPAYRFHGMLVYFAVFKNHYSLFPASGSSIAKMKDDLKGYTTSKGTIQFSLDNPVPTALIKKIVKIRMEENLEKAKEKTIKKKG